MRTPWPQLVVALLVSGCATPVAQLSPTQVASEGVVKPSLTSSAVALKGVAMAPAGILSPNTSSLVGNNSGGLIADKGGSLAAPTYGLLAVSALAPVAGADVEIQDASGKPVPGVESVKTDAQGAFTLKNVPAGVTWVIEVKSAAFHLTTLAAGVATGDTPIAVNPSTTVVTEHLRQSFGQDRAALRQVKAEEFAKLTREVGAAIEKNALDVDLKPAGKAADALALVTSKDDGIGQEVKAIVQAANEARKAEKDKAQAASPASSEPPSAAPGHSGDDHGKPSADAPDDHPGDAGATHANDHNGDHH